MKHFRHIGLPRSEHVLLAGEIVEEGALGNASALGNRVQRRGLEAVLREELKRCFPDAPVRLSAFALPPARLCRLCFHRSTTHLTTSPSAKLTIIALSRHRRSCVAKSRASAEGSGNVGLPFTNDTYT